MVKNNPLLTVCIINFNQGHFFKDAYASCLAQTYTNIEIIVIDDCSKDDSAIVMKGIIDASKRDVLFIENKINKGICKNINIGILQSKGEYFAVLAADDYLLPDHFANIMKTAVACSNDYKVFFTSCVIVDENKEVLKEDYIKFHKKSDFIFNEETAFIDLVRGNFIASIGVVIKKDVFDIVGYYDENFILEDYDMWLRIARKFKFKFLPQQKVFYRIVKNSLIKRFAKNKRVHQENFEFFYKFINDVNQEEYLVLREKMLYHYYKHFKKNGFSDMAFLKKGWPLIWKKKIAASAQL